MIPILCNLYGPLNINSYGFMIALGLSFFQRLCKKDRILQKILKPGQLNQIIFLGTMAGIVGGRLYCIFYQNSFESIAEFFQIYYGGFSILGTIIGILFVLPPYLVYHKIPIQILFDRFALYAGLLQSFSRIGCLLAGCCYGIPSKFFWAITYTNPLCKAPLNIPLHPVQIYSSLTLLSIFLLMKFKLEKVFTKPGQLISTYIALFAFQRFALDFLRSDRTYTVSKFLSFDQMTALIVLLGSIGFFIISSSKVSTQKTHESV